MKVYIRNFVHTSNGIYHARDINDERLKALGSYMYVLENNMELIVPNNVELEIGDEVEFIKPIKSGKYHDIELAELFGLLNGYCITSGNFWMLMLPDVTEKELINIAKDIKRIGRKYLKKDFYIEPNVANNSIDISDFMHYLKAQYSFGLGVVPSLVLRGDIATILSFLKPWIPLFQETGNGYLLRVLSETLVLEIVQLMVRIGIVPKEVGAVHLIISTKDFEALKKLTEGKGNIYGEPVKLKVEKKFNIGIREFTDIENVIAINGISVESLEVKNHDRKGIQKKIA